MKVINILILLLVLSSYSSAQGLATFNPIIDEMPSPHPRINFDQYNFNQFDRAEWSRESKNRSYYEAILEVQSGLLDLIDASEDAGLDQLARKHYNILNTFKKKGDNLYMYTEELMTARSQMEREIKDYIDKHYSKNEESNEVPLTSYYYEELRWDDSKKEYYVKYEYPYESNFYLTNNTISFKKGNFDWKINEWGFLKKDDETGYLLFGDGQNQLYCLGEEELLIYYEFDGENFKKLVKFEEVANVKSKLPPWINSADFQKMK